MSFWSAIGDIFTGGGSKRSDATSAFNKAQAIAALPPGSPIPGSPGYTGYAKGAGPNNFIANSGVVQAGISDATAALAFVPTTAVHALSATYNVGDIAAANGGSQWTPLTSWSAWKNAWNQTSGGFGTGKGPGLGQSIVGSIANHDLLSAPANKPQGGIFGTGKTNAEWATKAAAANDTWTGRIAAGAIDTAASWYADPTIGVAKLAKVARAASTITDASDAENAIVAATKINKGETSGTSLTAVSRLNPLGKTGLFSDSMEEAGNRLFQFVKTTDNGGNLAGRQQLVSRTPETAPVLGLFDQADKIADTDLQRQVKIDIIGAAQGSDVARQRLIDTAPQIARAVQRATTAPEGREALDAMNAAFADVGSLNPQKLYSMGESFHSAAMSFATPENAAELAAYGKHLDTIHQGLQGLDDIADIGSIQTAGLTALQRAKAALNNKVAGDLFFQDGPSSATVRVLHWGADQRFRGTVAVDHTGRGNAELMDHLVRTKLFTGSERADVSNAFLTAPNQEARRRVVDQVWGSMYAKVGQQYGMEPAEIKVLANKDREVRQASRRYATQQLEAARMSNADTVTLYDPTGGATSVKRSVFDTHIANNVVLPDPSQIQDTVRRAKLGPSLTDSIATRAAAFNNLADSFNNTWRLFILGRPGLLFRTQIDTQGRALAVMNGTAFVKTALTGLGHTVQNKVLKDDELVQVDAVAADLDHADQLDQQAAQLRRTAQTRSVLAGQRSGTAVEPVIPANLNDVSDTLHGKGPVDLPVNADSLANTTASALVARAEALEAQAAHLRDTKYWTERHALGTRNETINLKGGKSLSTRAYRQGQTKSDIESALYTGGRPGDALTQTAPKDMTEVLNNAVGRHQRRLYEDASNWKTYAPTDEHWAAGWIRTTDQMRNSYVGHKILTEADSSTTDLVKSLREDPKAQQEWREVRGDNEDFDEWIGRAVSHVAWAAPTKEVRQALLTEGHMTPDRVAEMFAKPGVTNTALPQRMHIQGPSFSFNPPVDTKPESVGRRFIKAMSDKPDLVAGRHPVYVDRYRYHVKGLAQRAFDQNPDWETLPAAAQAKIERVATHRAIQDTQQVMYDTAKHTGAHATLRYVSPFIGAWQDALESWSRLMYDNPAVAGGFNKIWNAPNRMGMVVDENSNPVAPGQQSNQSYLVLPAEFSNKFSGSRHLQIRKDSLNSIFQGAQWYTPGTGPVVQVPMQELVAHIYPQLGDSKNPIVQSILPFGTPKTGSITSDVESSVLPGWMKGVQSMWNSKDPNNASAYLASVNQQIIDARKAGRPIPSAEQLDHTASVAASIAGLVRAASLFGFGISGTATNESDFYKKQYDLLQQNAAALYKQGTSPSAEFVKQHPEAAGLQWSLTKSETGVQATINAFDAEKKYASFIKANPTYGWFYVGSANLSKDPFSQSAYNAQYSRTAGNSGDGPERAFIGRTGKDPNSGIVGQSLAEDGWSKYNAIKMAVDQKLKEFGINSITDSAAANLKGAQDQAIQQLRKDNPAWAFDYDNQDSGKLQRFIEDIATPATADPKLKSRPDIQLLGQYLALRQQALAKASSWGYKSLTAGAAANLRSVLYQAGQDFASQNLGFQQIWTRMLQNEVSTPSDGLTQKAAS